MNFQELGLILQREREKKGLSVDVVMEATKVSRINLIALEDGDRSSLPHSVYTKGFVKSYARFLGLDADELSMIVDREYQAEGQSLDEVAYDVSPLAEKMFQETDTSATGKRPLWPLGFGVVILIAIIFFIVYFNENDKKQPVEVTASAEVVEKTVQSEPDPVISETEEKTASPEATESEDDTTGESESTEQLAAPEAVAPVVEPQKPEAEPVKKIEKEVVKTQAAKPEKQKYDHVLIIRATTDKGCWIGVWKGDEAEMARDFVLKKGEPLRLMFNNPRRIRIGNAAGVSVLYNGKSYPLNSAKGNIQTLRFGTE